MLPALLESVDADQDEQGNQAKPHEPEDGPLGGVAVPIVVLLLGAAAAGDPDAAAPGLPGFGGLPLFHLLSLELEPLLRRQHGRGDAAQVIHVAFGSHPVEVEEKLKRSCILSIYSFQRSKASFT